MKKVSINSQVISLRKIESGVRDRAMETLQKSLKDAQESGDAERLEFVQRAIVNNHNNPATHRLEIALTPSVVSAMEEAAKVARTDDREATIGVVTTDQVTRKPKSLMINITDGGMMQLSGCGIDATSLPAYAKGATFTADVIIREIGDVVPDSSSEGRATGGEISIRQGSTALQNQELHISEEKVDRFTQAKLIAEATVAANRAKREILTLTPLSHAQAKTEKKKELHRKQGQKKDQFAKYVEDQRAAFAVENKVNLEDVVIADLSGNELTDYADATSLVLEVK